MTTMTSLSGDDDPSSRRARIMARGGGLFTQFEIWVKEGA